MDFGKVSDVSRVDFRLPPDESGSLDRLRSARPSGGVRAYVGCPVWTTKEWVGKVYPLGTPPREFLRLYSRQFNCIELNTTYYRIPDEATVRAWREAVPPEFRFCPKFPQQITHELQLRNAGSATRAFCDALAGLGGNLGTSFLQLPPQFSPGSLPVLSRFLAELPRGFAVAVEFRHPEWFRENALIPGAVEALERAGAATVITDVAGRRDVVHGSLTRPAAMIRFIGNGLHPTDYSRADEWLQKLKGWITAGLRELWFFTHEPDNILAPELANHVITGLNRECGLGLAQWERRDQGKQLGLFG